MTLKTATLAEVCQKITDGSHNPPKGVEFSDYLMLSSKNILDDHITLESPRYLSEQDFRIENQRTKVTHGDVLLTIVGTIGRAAVVDSSLKNIALQRSVAVLRPKPDLLDSRYLMFMLQHGVEMLNANARGVAQKGIYLNTLKGLRIPLPTLAAQQETVRTLDNAFAAIEAAAANARKQLDLMGLLRQSIMARAFSGQPLCA